MNDANSAQTCGVCTGVSLLFVRVGSNHYLEEVYCHRQSFHGLPVFLQELEDRTSDNHCADKDTNEKPGVHGALHAYALLAVEGRCAGAAKRSRVPFSAVAKGRRS